MLISQPSVETLLQSLNAPLHVKPQTADAHVAVALGTPGHTPPHEPQFAGSVSVETQAPLHGTSPRLQFKLHVDLSQTSLEAHTLTQDPQWAGSLAVSTQVPLQEVLPEGHRHAPDTQLVPPVQTLLHAPQFAGSPDSSRHTPLHSESPFGHSQTEATHVVPPAQTWPHLPQLSGSVSVDTHVPPQDVLPGGQPPSLASTASTLTSGAPSPGCASFVLASLPASAVPAPPSVWPPAPALPDVPAFPAEPPLPEAPPVPAAPALPPLPAAPAAPTIVESSPVLPHPAADANAASNTASVQAALVREPGKADVWFMGVPWIGARGVIPDHLQSPHGCPCRNSAHSRFAIGYPLRLDQ